MILTIPELSLVALIGASGSGKSSFARQHFRETEVLSSDYFRALVADDETDMAATPDAFAALHFVAGRDRPLAELREGLLRSRWADKRAPLEYYSRERITSWEARTRWVEPDLRPLEDAP